MSYQAMRRYGGHINEYCQVKYKKKKKNESLEVKWLVQTASKQEKNN